MKQLISLILIFILAFVISVPAFAEGNISLKLNGSTVNCDVPPIISSGRTLIPVRAVFEDLGAYVSWNADKRIVAVKYNGIEVKLTIDSNVAYVSGTAKTMDVPATIINGRTLIPVRFVAENLGLSVGWDDSTRTVNIMSQSVSSDKHVLRTGNVGTFEKETVVNLIGMGKAKVSVMTLQNPERLVFDFQNTQLAVSNPNVSVNDTYIKSVRFGQFDATTTRVVLDIQANVSYDFYHNPSDGDYVIRVCQKGYTPVVQQPVAPNAPLIVPAGEKIVFIDPGHGGSEVGTIGKLYEESSNVLVGIGASPTVEKSYYEKDTNLSISLKVNALLNQAGVKTCILRTTDQYINIYDRPVIANNSGAYLYLSIHNNASTSASVHGTQVYYSDSDLMPSYTNMTNKQVANIYYEEITSATGLRKAGVIDNPKYIVINQTKMPALILEIGFFSNQDELKKLLDDSFQNIVAQAICNATVKVLNTAADIQIPQQ